MTDEQYESVRVPTSVIRDGEPVSEETEAGLVVASALSEDIEEHLSRKRAQILASIAVGALALVAGVYFLLTGALTIGVASVLAAVVAVGAGAYAYRRPPAIRLERAEKRFWTTHLLPHADGVMIVDGTNSLSSTSFGLEYIDDHDRLQHVIDNLQQVTDLPVVLPYDRNVETTLQEDLSQLNELLSDTEQRTIELPAVKRDSGVVDGIDTIVPHANGHGNEQGGDAVEIPIETARKQADTIGKMETIAAEDDIGETFSTVRDRSNETLDRITEAQEEMVELLNDNVGSVGDTLMMTGYNFYCPNCLEDDIYTELVPRGSAGEPEWYCETCLEDHAVEQSVPINRIKDDLVEDIWDRLWVEKDDQKRTIYEDIEDQQAELAEREFEQKQEIIRDGWNRIKDIRSKIRDLKTEATAGKGAIDEIGEVMVKYDRLREERKAQFQEDVARAVDQVDQETEDVLEATRNLEQEKTQAAEKEAQQRAEIRHEEQRRRHRERLAAADGGLGILGSLSSKVHKQKTKFKRRRIETTQAAEDWGEPDRRGSLAVNTDRPIVAGATAALLQGEVTGVVSDDEVTVYFEWRERDADSGLLARESWTSTEKQRLGAPGPFEGDLTGLDSDAAYEIRAVAEADGDRYTGETLRYPVDARTETDTDTTRQAVRERLADLEADAATAETGERPAEESTAGEQVDDRPDAADSDGMNREPAEQLGDLFGDRS